jgi:ATP-binding cassette, subfamily C (CFTR/MRP), member 1
MRSELTISLSGSVDTQTDSRMQEVIRTEFRHCTIIMIAHRLDTLLDFDKVAVFDKGSMIEFGEPSKLLADDGSAFSKLYHASSGRQSPTPSAHST